jgi:hypothetical protein
MHRFKKSLIALIGVLTLVGIVTVTVPHIGRGASGTGSNAPTTQTQNVNVVNTPNVNAQQSGTWNVGINGTPVVGLDAGNNTVKFDAVNNTVKIDSATPILIRDVDNPARQPFQTSMSLTMNDGFGNNGRSFEFDVPAGKRAVVEYFSAFFQLPTGQKLTRLIVTTNYYGGVFHDFGTTYTGTSAGFDTFVTSQQTRLYADAVGGRIFVNAYRTDSIGTASGSVSISGYLVDVP